MIAKKNPVNICSEESVTDIEYSTKSTNYVYIWFSALYLSLEFFYCLVLFRLIDAVLFRLSYTLKEFFKLVHVW